MKKITTSAQKTVDLPKDVALARLRRAVAEQESADLAQTKNPDIYSADFKDGSKLCVAGFEAENGRAIVMIDHRNVAEADREYWQTRWRRTIDGIFE